MHINLRATACFGGVAIDITSHEPHFNGVASPETEPLTGTQNLSLKINIVRWVWVMIDDLPNQIR